MMFLFVLVAKQYLLTKKHFEIESAGSMHCHRYHHCSFELTQYITCINYDTAAKHFNMMVEQTQLTTSNVTENELQQQIGEFNSFRDQ